MGYGIRYIVYDGSAPAYRLLQLDGVFVLLSSASYCKLYTEYRKRFNVSIARPVILGPMPTLRAGAQCHPPTPSLH